jgi:hypothetical protein
MPACFEMTEGYLALNKNFMKTKKNYKTIDKQSISGRKKYFIASFISGIIAMFFVVFSASAAVALPTDVGLPNGSLIGVISNLTNWLLGIFGFLAIISFLISGLMYFLAAGDDKAEEKAKKQMIWSITGVVIGLVGLVVIYAVNMLLNGGGASFGTGSFSSSSSYSSSSSSSSASPSASNPTEWAGEGQIINPDGSPGNRTFIDQQGRSFELKDGSLVPMNDTSTNSGPASSYQP